jgi:hypothetical protein
LFYDDILVECKIPYHGSDGVFGFAWDVRGAVISILYHEGWDRKFGCSKDTLQDALVFVQNIKIVIKRHAALCHVPTFLLVQFFRPLT